MNKLGFGYLHLPMQADQTIDYAELNRMVDQFLASGRNYFDTAYTYLDGNSEIAIRESLVKRYPRNAFRLATKMPGYKVKSYEDCSRFFEEERTRCGVEFFDVYMLHWLNAKHYRIAESTGQFDFLKELKEQGKAREIGFSYHDTAELLDEILTGHPEVDLVLIQLNFADWESESIQSRKCYETIVKHGKKVLVMEPVKGGTLTSLPEDVEAELKAVFPNDTAYSRAFRFAESLPGVEIVLSGMTYGFQVEENTKEREPLTEAERSALLRAAEKINGATVVKCSGCGYCMKECPKQICIPNYFRLYNEISRNPKEGWKIKPVFKSFSGKYGRPTDCIGCGLCEASCPQKLSIRHYLKQTAEAFS